MIIAQNIRIPKARYQEMRDAIERGGYEVVDRYDSDTAIAIDIYWVSERVQDDFRYHPGDARIHYRFLYHPESYERDEMGIRGDQHYMFVSHVYDDTKAQLPENLFRLCQLMAPYVTPGSWLIVQEDKVCPLRGYYLYPDGVYEAANIQVHSEKGPKMAAFCDLTDIRYTLWWFEHKDETR